MKTFAVTLFFFLGFFQINAQSQYSSSSNDFTLNLDRIEAPSTETVFVKPFLNTCSSEEDKLGCSIEHFVSFIKDQVAYPAVAQENGFESEILIQFQIDEHGQIENLNYSGDYVQYFKGTIEKAFQEFSQSALSWNPGQLSNASVKVPVEFRLDFSL